MVVPKATGRQPSGHIATTLDCPSSSLVSTYWREETGAYASPVREAEYEARQPSKQLRPVPVAA
jgi:hypothetical protein